MSVKVTFSFIIVIVLRTHQLVDKQNSVKDGFIKLETNCIFSFISNNLELL